MFFPEGQVRVFLYAKQETHERKFVGFVLIRGRPCVIRTCDQRIKSRGDFLNLL
jgi:hypothetical protein